MSIEIGRIESLHRFPVKSMAGESLPAAELGWHGIEGDRRLALRKRDDHGEFPFLTAGRLPELLRFTPVRLDAAAAAHLPTHVRTPDGRELPVFGDELAEEIGGRFGAPVRMLQFRNGIFDDACVSIIAAGTVEEISRLAGQAVDVRRFRPNVFVRLTREGAFLEDEWVGSVLAFGGGDDAPAVAVTTRDIRCSMINLDPDSAAAAPEMMKAVVRVNQNFAGVYGTVVRAGRLEVGQPLILRAARSSR